MPALSCGVGGDTAVGGAGRLGLRPEGGAAHPGLQLKVLEPVLHRGDPAEVVHHVLLADGARTGTRLASLLVTVAPKMAWHRKMPSEWWRRARWRTSAMCALLSSNQSWMAR